MGLSNSAARSRNYTSTINQNQGGGSKKAGFPYQVGRNMMSSIWIKDRPLATYQRTLVFANISRNIGRNNNASYWNIPTR